MGKGEKMTGLFWKHSEWKITIFFGFALGALIRATGAHATHMIAAYIIGYAMHVAMGWARARSLREKMLAMSDEARSKLSPALQAVGDKIAEDILKDIDGSPETSSADAPKVVWLYTGEKK